MAVAARLTACTCVRECLHLCVNAIKKLYAHMYTASLGHLNEVEGVLHQNSFSHSVQSAWPKPGLNKALFHKEPFTA